MFSFCFALIVLINLSVNGQNNNLDIFPSKSVESGAFFGQLHHLIDQQNRDQPPSISCSRIRANIKNAYPIDNTKYFICRDEQRFEIFTCPNGGIFDDREKACIDLCEQKKPCLNQGQCIILSNLTLQCICRRDWTGEQCEIPLSTCASQPCGLNAECRMLQTGDYSQDYVCICDNQKTYGRNCQKTVPNPCLKNIQQFHPFAFSRRAYINCDDERIFFQPCNDRLYWNQEHKRCDRLLPLLLRSPFLNLKVRIEPNSQQSPFDVIQSTQWQNLPALSQISNNQPSLTNTFVQTTTVAPRIFHLKGFLSKNMEWQNNGNNQLQPLENLKSQSWSQDQNQQTISQLPTSVQQNNPLGFIQSQSGQWTPSPFETTTVANNVPQGSFSYLLRGWQSDQQTK